MKAIMTFSLDNERAVEIRNACARCRIPLSNYIEYALEVAPPVDDTLAQFLSMRKRGVAPASVEELAMRKPVYEIPSKGWHFHADASGYIGACMTPGCEKERTANPEYYEDEMGNIYSSTTSRIVYPAKSAV